MSFTSKAVATDSVFAPNLGDVGDSKHHYSATTYHFNISPTKGIFFFYAKGKNYGCTAYSGALYVCKKFA